MINKFNENLKTLRKRAGMNQTQLADILGINQSTVAGWESNKSKPQFDIIIELCDIFSCTPNDLILDVHVRTKTDLNKVPDIPEPGNNFASMLHALFEMEEDVRPENKNLKKIQNITNGLIAENSNLKDKIIALYTKVDGLRTKVENLL